MTGPEGTAPDRGKSLVLVLTLLNTVLVALVTTLQLDSGIRASQALRASQAYAVQTTGDLVRLGAQGDYDLTTFARLLYDSQDALVSEYSALQRQAAGDLAGTEALLRQAQAAQARAERAGQLSIFMTSPAYAPSSDQDTPDLAGYLEDQQADVTELLRRQNAASDDYHRWNQKSDSYVANLTVLAVAFFLLGIAQTVRPGLRRLFTAFAIAALAIGALWCLLVLAS